MIVALRSTVPAPALQVCAQAPDVASRSWFIPPHLRNFAHARSTDQPLAHVTKMILNHRDEPLDRSEIGPR